MSLFRRGGLTVAGCASLVGLAGCAAMFGGLPRHSQLREIPVAGSRRDFILHVPGSYRADQPTPLVILLHGHGARAASFERSTGMSGKANKEGFIVAYPQALGSPSVWHTAVDGSARIDDVAFLRTLIDSIAQEYNIDPRRIYVAGHSNGAFMAYRVGSVLSARIAALGISAGSIGRITRAGDTLRIRQPVNPVSVIAFHGKADTSVPYNGGAESDGPRRIVPAPQSVDFWVNSDQCNDTPERTVMQNGNVIRESYTGCKDSTQVVLYTIEDGTHRWPGDETPWWKFAGNTTHALSATNEMWAFFAAHPKLTAESTSVSATRVSATH